MKLFLANPTTRPHRFSYRLKDARQENFIHIPAGDQVELRRNDMTPEMANYIVDQNRHYGLFQASEIDREKGRIDTLFNFDTPVTAQQIARTMKHNDSTAVKQVQEMRLNAARAISHDINKNTSGSLKKLTVEVSELTRRDQSPEMGAEVIEIMSPTTRSSSRRRG